MTRRTTALAFTLVIGLIAGGLPLTTELPVRAAEPVTSATDGIVAISCPGELGSSRDVCVVNLTTQERTNLTRDLGGANQHPTWSPDGKWIVFSHSAQAVLAPLDGMLYRVRADGSAPPQSLGVAGFQPNWGSGNQMYRFDAGATVGAVTYAWEFGDGAVGQRAQVEHAYFTTPGQVTLMATNLLGMQATVTKPADSTTGAAKLQPAISLTRGAGLEVSFELRSLVAGAPGTVDWSWDFGDGTTSTELNPTYAYAAPGTYTVTLRAEALDQTVARATATFAVGNGATGIPPWPGFSAEELGSKIVFVRVHPDYPDGQTTVGTMRAATELAIVNPDGSNPQRLINPTGFSRALEPQWRPDGERVAYAFSKSGGPSSSLIPRLQIASQSGEPSASLATWNNVTHAFARAPDGTDDPAWSPDGTRIAYVKCTLIDGYGICRNGTTQIAVMDSDGTDTGSREIVLTDSKQGAFLRQPAWSPDGTVIAYQDTSAGIVLVSPDSSPIGEMPTTVIGDAEPSWRPGIDDLTDDVVLPANAGGEPQFYFTDVNDAFARIRVPLSATDRELCIFKAIPGENTKDLNCTKSEELPTDFSDSVPLPATGTLGPAELVDLAEFYGDTLSPGRWYLSLRWKEGDERLGAASRAFTITCKGENCGEASLVSVQSLRNASESIGALCDALTILAVAETLGDVVEVHRQRRTTPTPAQFWVGVGIDLAAPVVGEVLNNMAWNLISPLGLSFLKDNYMGALEQQLRDEEGRLQSRLFRPDGSIDDSTAQRLKKTQLARESATASKRSMRGFGSAGAMSAICDTAKAGLNLVIAALDAPAQRSRTRMTERVVALAAAGPYDQPVTIAFEGDPVVTEADELAIHFDRIGLISTALAEALGRANAAGQAGDARWQAAHLDAASQLTALLAAAQRSLTEVLAGRQSDPELAAALGRVLMTPEQALRAQQIIDRLGATGFTAEELEYFRSQGLTDDEILNLQTGAAAAEVPTQVVGRSMSNVLATSITALQASTEQALDPLRGATAIRSAEVFRGARANATAHDVLIDTPTSIAISADDPDGDLLTYTLLTQPSHGTLSGTAPKLLYTPAAGYLGPDSFTFVADDGDGPSLPATVSITVALPPPVGQLDEYGARQGQLLSVPAPGVLANDDSPRLPLTARLERGTAGLTVFRPDGSFEFEAPTDVTGPVTFTYRARFVGSVESPPITVTIVIADRQDPPAPVGDVVELSEDASAVFRPTDNDADPDGDPVTLLGFGQPTRGSVTCTLNATCTYTPAANFTGVDVLDYTVSDGTGRTATARVSFVVAPVADPPRPAADRLTFVKGSPATMNVLANDVHPDGLTFTLVASTVPTSGSVTCDPVGSCTYTPANATVAGDSFTYTVRDSAGLEAVATVTVAAFAAFEEIASDGPLLYIDTGASLSCAVEYEGDDLGSFFADFGCGTFAAVGGDLYGPERISGSGNPPQPRTTFTSRTQSTVTGTGTFDDPFRLTTGVDLGGTGVSLAQADQYVQGEESYRTDLTLSNASGSPRTVTLYRAGDCQLGDFDTGLGRLDPVTGGAACVAANGRILEWLPLSVGSSPFEGGADDVWAAIAAQQPFDGSCRCDEDIDNGAGLSWTITLAPGEARTVSHLTVFSPFGYAPLSTSAVADEPVSGPGTVNGYSVTVANPNSTTPVTVSQVAVQLPAGFSYIAGSTSGSLTAEPVHAGQVLRWAGPLSVPAGGSATFHLSVATSLAPGVHLARVSGAAAPFAVTPTGPTAPIEVVANLAPVARLSTGGGGAAISVDGRASSDADGTVVAWAWDFGDGHQGSGATAPHTYALPGNYVVTLVVTDDLGATGETSRVVTIAGPNLPPVAVQSEAADRTAPRTLAFNGAGSTDDDGYVNAWRWDFGDGSSGSGAEVTHTFAGDGVYEVRLTVTDDRGAQGQSVASVIVLTPNAPPVASFVAAASGLTATFDASASSDADGTDGLPVEYAWTFGDGATGNGVAPRHTYPVGGEYQVTLLVTDADGAQDEVMHTVGVGDSANVAPTAAVDATTTLLEVALDGTGSVDVDGTIVYYEWNLGDEAVAQGAQPVHVYSAPGTYLVELIVTDDDGAVDRFTRQVRITADPEATTTTSTTTTTTVPPTTSTTSTTLAPTTSTTSTTVAPTSTTVAPTTTSTTTTSTSTTSTSTTSTSTTSTSTTSTSTTSTTTPSIAMTTTSALGNEPPPATNSPTTLPRDPVLPSTGADSRSQLWMGFWLALIGATVVFVNRRRFGVRRNR